MPNDEKRPAAFTDKTPPAETRSSDGDVAAFLNKLKVMAPIPGTGARGRLIFAMDATMSREPAWDLALALQAEMFHEVKAAGGLDVQLVFFRGIDECRASRWASDAEALARLMASVKCQGGNTQIGKVLAHARRETGKAKVNALVYVGDAMEEDIDHLAQLAGELGLLGLPVFLFQEGYDAGAATAFRELARLSRGAYSTFDAGSARQLRDLLRAVAVYASGGQTALESYSKTHGGQSRLLLDQLKR
jgi:hypothetical protein